MKVKIINLEKGQSLVVVTLLLMVFFGMLALVLDGGYSYFMRRNAQNAADAGALAATDIWCETEDWDAAYNEGKYYAEDLNGADDEESIITPAGEKKVRVETNITFDTFFGRLLGRDQITAVASATAGCYPLGSGLGVLPIAWSCRPPIGENPTADCEMRWKLEGDDCAPESDNMYVIMDSATIEDDTLCQEPINCIEDGVACTIDGVDCDIDNESPPDNDLEPLSGGNRAWLDLNGDGDGGGAANLKSWVEFGFPEDVDVHYWFAGQTGVIASVYGIVDQTQKDNDVIIPVFDQYCPDGAPNSVNPSFGACPNLVHPGEDTTIISQGNSTDYFHVISFAVFHITCVDAQGAGPCPGKIALDLAPEVKTIEGCFIKDYVPGGGGGPNTNPWVGAWVVYLIE